MIRPTIAVLAMIAALSSCSSSSPPPVAHANQACADGRLSKSCADARIARGVHYVESVRTEIDPASLMFFSYIGKRWDVLQLRAFEEDARSATGALSTTNAFVRLLTSDIDADRKVIDQQQGLNALTAPWLECDDDPPDRQQRQAANIALREGGYEASHALLGFLWARELDCPYPSRQRIDAAIRVVLQEFSRADRFTDLAAEQFAFLCYAGMTPSIPQSFLESLFTAQHADGGWPTDAAVPPEVHKGDLYLGRSNWHSTGLAIWALSCATRGDAMNLGMVP